MRFNVLFRLRIMVLCECCEGEGEVLGVVCGLRIRLAVSSG